MDLSDDLSPPRRPLFFPVVIATVFLSIIAMSAGLVLGQRADDRAAEDRRQQQEQRRQQEQRQAPPVQHASDTRQDCRAETQAAAADFGATGTLKIVLLVRTRTSAVWICEDESGRLYYHANRGGEDAPWVERKTALMLPGTRRDGDGYVATASDGTTFSVTRERLLITHQDGKTEVQRAVE